MHLQNSNEEIFDLMKQIDFSNEEINEVLGYIHTLKEKGFWEEMLVSAAEVISKERCSNTLNEKISQMRDMAKNVEIHEYSLNLVFLLLCTLYLKQKYEDKGYSLQMYYDSMKDITYKLHECQKVYGITGNFVPFWYDGFFDLTRFALGRMQFEMAMLCLEKTVVLNGYKLEHGNSAINMHIPSSGPLKPEEVVESFHKAKKCFEKEFPDRPIIFVIASWLLDEDLVQLLPDGNVKEFVKQFIILKTYKNGYFDDGWRVFGKDWNGEMKNLPRNTRLQRAIADYLQQGGDLGYGYAVMIYE